MTPFEDLFEGHITVRDPHASIFPYDGRLSMKTSPGVQ